MANTPTNAVKVVLTDSFTTGANSNQDMYTAPALTTTLVHSLMVANVDGTNDTTIDVAIDTGGAVRSLGKNLPLPAGSVFYYPKVITLKAGDRLKIRAANASYAEAVMAAIEQT